MIHYNRGKSLTYNEISLMHWGVINPMTQKGTYKKRESLIGRVEGLRDKNRTKNFRKYKFYNFLLSDDYKFLKLLITSKPSKLESIAIVVNKKLKQLKLNNFKFLEELQNKAFQYDNWRSNGKFEELFNLLDISICPYCNHQDLFKDSERNIVIASCDHYLDKGRYPYLSLSFYNLIPACSICNGPTYKGTKSFSVKTHIHPYVDNFNTLGEFDSDFVEGCSEHNIILKTNNGRAINYAKAFGIKRRYAQQSVKSIAKQVYYNSINYSEVKKRELIIEWGLMNLEQVEKKICKMFDIPAKENEIRSFDLGKLKRDLSLKHKLISY